MGGIVGDFLWGGKGGRGTCDVALLAEVVSLPTYLTLLYLTCLHFLFVCVKMMGLMGWGCIK